MGEEKRMKVKLYFLLHMGFIAIFLLLPVCEAGETQWSVEPGTILSTATKDFQLNSQDELVQYLSTAPRSTPYLDKIELRTETEDFDPDKQKFSLRFYPKGWGETASKARLRETRNQSRELAYNEWFHKVLKDRYDLIIEYLEIRTVLDIEEELLVNLSDQIRVLQALVPGDLTFDVGRLMDAQDDLMAHQLRQVELENRLTGLAHGIMQLTGCGEHFAVQTDGLVTVAKIRSLVADLYESAKASSGLHPSLADRQIQVRIAEEEYHLEVAKNRDFISFFDVSYDLADRDEDKKAVSLEVGVRLPFIHKDRDDILRRRAKWMEAKIDFSEAERKWSQKRYSTHHQLMRYLDQYDLLTARKKTGDAATSYEVYRKMDGVNPLELLKIRESILKNDLRLEETRFSVFRRFIDLLDANGRLSIRPLVNYLSATQEEIL